MKCALALLLATMSIGLRADSLQFLLFAVDAGVADKVPPEVADDPSKLIQALEKLEQRGSASAPVRVSQEVKWNQRVVLEEGKEFKYFTEFDAEGDTLNGAGQEIRRMGYQIESESTKQNDALAHLLLNFEWTPTVEKIDIKGGGREAWMPRFRTIRSTNGHFLAKGRPHLAATWRTGIPLEPRDDGKMRQLYLFVSWTDKPASK